MLNKLMSKLQTIILMALVLLILLGCSKEVKNQKIDDFHFDLLSYTNSYFNDSTRVKLNLYFNNLDIEKANNLLENIQHYRQSKEKHLSSKNKRLMSFSTPTRLKRKKITDEDGNNHYILDSLFYEDFKINNLIFIADRYYNKIENIRISRKEYEENIKTAITFKYDINRPISFYGNTLRFNTVFRNNTSKDIRDFVGVIYICDGDMKVLIKVPTNSSDLNRNVFPDQLKPIEIDGWHSRILSKYYTDVNDLEITVSADHKKQLQDNYKKLALFFVVKNIRFKDGSYLSQ